MQRRQAISSRFNDAHFDMLLDYFQEQRQSKRPSPLTFYNICIVLIYIISWQNTLKNCSYIVRIEEKLSIARKFAIEVIFLFFGLMFYI